MKLAVIAPHPDDETLGCGGTILNHIKNNWEVIWIIVTDMSKDDFKIQQINHREKEIEQVRKLYNFKNVVRLKFNANRLDEYPTSEVVGSIFSTLHSFSPDTIFFPFSNDIHSDHRIVSKAVLSATKNFRLPSLKKLLMYETISETDFGSNALGKSFNPNVFYDISNTFKEKCDIFKIYESEVMNPPLPRSLDSIEALSKFRGSSIGKKYAEAFQLIKEII